MIRFVVLLLGMCLLQSSMVNAAPQSDSMTTPTIVSPAQEVRQDSVVENENVMDDLVVGELTADGLSSFGGGATADFQSYSRNAPGQEIGSDFFGLNDDFDSGLLIKNDTVAMKIGGFLKVDFIQDFDPIGNTDAFDVTTIEIGAAPRTNTRFHTRQSRLNWDTRWNSELGPIRVFVEGDFFFNQRESFELGENRFRLRHAFAQWDKWTIGQTWTTLSDIAASPPTLDFEGQVASINTRRTILRWTNNIESTDWKLSLALEDPFTIIDVSDLIDGVARTQTPDAVIRLRWSRPNLQFQTAGVLRKLGFQPDGSPVLEGDAWGINFSQVAKLNSKTKVYAELLWGSGIGSFRGLPDAAPTTAANVEVVNTLGWMVGGTYNWTDRLSSNVTYAENSVGNTDLLPNEIKRATYLAANLIYEPTEQSNLGIEYLYGTRQNTDGQQGFANRVQVAFTFFLP